MAQIIECVPNFSEGRDPGVLDGIVAAMTAVPGITLLDREMDASHHRAVQLAAASLVLADQVGKPLDVL